MIRQSFYRLGTHLDLLVDQVNGVWHRANDTATTWSGFAFTAINMAGLDHELIHQVREADFNPPAKRPVYSALMSERGILLRTLEDVLGRFFREVNIN